MLKYLNLTVSASTSLQAVTLRLLEPALLQMLRTDTPGRRYNARNSTGKCMGGDTVHGTLTMST